MSGAVRTWNPEDADEIDATDYVIGSVLGAWEYDEDSLIGASLLSLTGVLVQTLQMDPVEAFDKAMEWVFPPDDSEEERTLGISVKKDEDGKVSVQFRFGDEEVES